MRSRRRRLQRQRRKDRTHPKNLYGERISKQRREEAKEFWDSLAEMFEASKQAAEARALVTPSRLFHTRATTEGLREAMRIILTGDMPWPEPEKPN